jgi:hypothetical protein
MAHSLNLTLKIKQDPATLAKLEEFKAIFPRVQGRIAEVMKASRILHFARIVVIDNKYIQVLTEYDGDRQAYTEFFRQQLPDVFGLVFALADDAPPPDQLKKLLSNPDDFFAYTMGKDIKPLGTSISGDPGDNWVFSAYGNMTVKEILPLLPQDRLP